MARCPECGGIMEYNPALKLLVCTSCGLAVTRSELDRMHDEQRKRLDPQSREEERRKRRKEYLDWYLSSKKDE
ncbi:MAG: hypothetical protein Kow0069_36270 [Promethearchaeota archaeon]